MTHDSKRTHFLVDQRLFFFRLGETGLMMEVGVAKVCVRVCARSFVRFPLEGSCCGGGQD